jgi:hypothetical protein
MSATLIQNAMPGEALIAIDPELLQQTDPGWLHRLSLFSGRALTAAALRSEQAYRSGRLAILGQSVTHGVVKGLELTADLGAADPLVQIAPGYGISATGEDVALARTLRTNLSALQVFDLSTGKITPFPKFKADPANTSFAGVLLLQPVTAQISGDTFKTGNLPLIVSGNLNASCDQDPEEFAFQDSQMVDGVRLIMIAWPADSVVLALPAGTPAETWRNRLVYTVFNAEAALGADDQLPWDTAGVPVALIGFDKTWKPLFVDRAAVVRAGGADRSRFLIPGAPLVQPALAQARVTQLVEHLDGLPDLRNFMQAFALLPPCGVLPAAAMNFTIKEAVWFPSNWSVTAGPVHQEEIETALLNGMIGQPLDVSQNESVEILIPLPDEQFDPNVLVTETVDPAFPAAVQDATNEITSSLQHRKAVQQEANALAVVLRGTKPGPLHDLDRGLTKDELTLRDAKSYTPSADETFGTVPQSAGGYVSTDYRQLLTDAASPPYTITVDANGNALPQPLPLFSADDLKDLAENGLQHFIDRMSAKLARANDILDLAFLTTHSDIYRFRQYILGAQGATALAVSPIAAQIATGESAAVTAANLQGYLKTLLATPKASSSTTTTTPAPGGGAAPGGAGRFLFNARTFSAQLRPTTVTSINPTLRITAATGSTTAQTFSMAKTSAVSRLASTAFVPLSPGDPSQPASTQDVLAQSPVVGAQLNLRTLTIAQRLADPPTQEGLFYATGNRVALLQLLADLEITIDDIPILVDVPPPAAATTTPAPTTTPQANPRPVVMPRIADIRFNADPNRRIAVLNAVLTPQVTSPAQTDPDEAEMFSVGIHVLEQHSALLRAIEARIAQYNDFLAECRNKQSTIQTLLSQAEALVTRLENDLAQARQDLAFTTALLKDEQTRVKQVNDRRMAILASVQVIAYTRPRTLQTAADVPSRQLVPGNIANPTPSCLSQSVAIPPELREIVSLLREAPVSWMPSIEALLEKLERPGILHRFAFDLQARAAMQLALPLPQSSAATEPGVYAPLITSIFSANQQAFRTLQSQRATFEPASLVNKSWTVQVELLKLAAGIGDLMSSAAVHAEVANATARLVQQISSVATCVYARAGQALPVDRLEWAEFLRGVGVSIQLRSLAVLPRFNTLDYVARQQMQMLVDWLFLQIDTRNPDAVAFMSDVVRVAILLASDAPVDSVLGAAVALTTTPVVGGIVRLSLPSERIAAGMYVQLYSSGALSAHAVVTDFDSSGVRATVTHVFQEGVALQANDVAHFTLQAPVAPAIRAFHV